MLSLDTAYRSFGGEVEASSTPTICRLSDSRRHQLWAIALDKARHGASHQRWGALFGPGAHIPPQGRTPFMNPLGDRSPIRLFCGAIPLAYSEVQRGAH